MELEDEKIVFFCEVCDFESETEEDFSVTDSREFLCPMCYERRQDEEDAVSHFKDAAERLRELDLDPKWFI